jgi:hypothetical protein
VVAGGIYLKGHHDGRETVLRGLQIAKRRGQYQKYRCGK